MYVCFTSLKNRFKKRCKKIIGLHGCFLKNYVKGEILAEVGREGNNVIYPIAWAIVDVESTET